MTTAWAAVEDKSPADAAAQPSARSARSRSSLLDRLAGADWETPRETLWGEQAFSTGLLPRPSSTPTSTATRCCAWGCWWEFILGEIEKARAKEQTP